VFATGAVGFLAFSVAGLGKTVVSRMSALPRGPDDARTSETTLPLELLGDPFSHPKLTSAAAEVEASMTATPPSGEGEAPPSLPGGRGGFSGLAPFNVGIGPRLPNGEQPAETAGGNRDIEGGRRLSVALSAIVKVNRAVALLSVNDGESRAFRKGDLICPGLRLVEIGAGAVTLRTPQKTFELKVGGEAKP
jgi:hypothetical protein